MHPHKYTLVPFSEFAQRYTAIQRANWKLKCSMPNSAQQPATTLEQLIAADRLARMVAPFKNIEWHKHRLSDPVEVPTFAIRNILTALKIYEEARREVF